MEEAPQWQTILTSVLSQTSVNIQYLHPFKTKISSRVIHLDNLNSKEISLRPLVAVVTTFSNKAQVKKINLIQESRATNAVQPLKNKKVVKSSQIVITIVLSSNYYLIPELWGSRLKTLVRVIQVTTRAKMKKKITRMRNSRGRWCTMISRMMEATTKETVNSSIELKTMKKM